MILIFRVPPLLFVVCQLLFATQTLSTLSEANCDEFFPQIRKRFIWFRKGEEGESNRQRGARGSVRNVGICVGVPPLYLHYRLYPASFFSD